MQKYGEGFWIGCLKFFLEILFLGNIAIGVVMGFRIEELLGAQFGVQVQDPIMQWLLFFAPTIIAVIFGIFALGFLMVYLNMAADMRIARRYLTEIIAVDIRIVKEYLAENREKGIPVKDNVQQASKPVVTPVSVPVTESSITCKQCGIKLNPGDNFCSSCGTKI